MEGVDSLYTGEEEQTEEQGHVVQMATVATVETDGLTLIPDGAEEATEKHFKCNSALTFASGQRVAVLEFSGSKIVMFPVGDPGGGDTPTGTIPAGGNTGQVLKKSSDEDYALEWGSLPHGVPAGGSTNQVLAKSTNGDYMLKWIDLPSGLLPTGGTTGQVLKKSSATDYACTWGSIDGTLPTGGTDGQVLLKNGSTNYSVKWGSITGTLPTGGTSGQVLKKSSATNYACSWGSVDGTLPTGGSAGQYLKKTSATNYACSWATISPTVSVLTNGTYKLTLSGSTLTPGGTGYTIGTSSYPVTVRASSVVLYYNSYSYCTLTCTSAKKLAVNGTAIS